MIDFQAVMPDFAIRQAERQANAQLELQHLKNVAMSEDSLALYQWFDQSKAILADPRHRALRHIAEGIFMLATLCGATIVNADGRIVPVRLVGAQHVREDLWSIPLFADWARLIAPQAWMLRANRLAEPDADVAVAAEQGSEASFDQLRLGPGPSVSITI